MPRGVHNNHQQAPLTNQQHRMRGTPIVADTGNIAPIYELNCPEPPPELNEQALEEWDRLAPLLHAQGMLTEVDKAALAVYCQAYADWRSITRTLNAMRERDKSAEGNVIRGRQGEMVANPLIRVSKEAQKHLLQAAVEFGLTPVSRQRLKSSVIEEKGNKFASNAR